MIESLTPINKSYNLGFIKNKFPNYKLIDTYNGFRRVNNKNSIIYIEDEQFTNYKEVLKYIKSEDNNLLLTKDGDLNLFLKQNGFDSYHLPFWHIMDDLFSFIQIKDLINYTNKFDSDYNYICLNRNPSRYRFELIEKLILLGLLEKGFVTANFKNFNAELIEAFSDHRFAKLREDDLDHYIDTNTGFERHNHIINNVPCSSNVRNYMHISENLSGHTIISSETEYNNNVITEKSFLFLFCKKMPMVFFKFSVIDILRKEGFDVFDDVIDHSYVGLSWSDQIIKGIDDNKNILSNKLIHLENEINQRTENNFDYFCNKWFPDQLEKLTNIIFDWGQQ